MNESSKRHQKLLSLIFTLNCLSKTSVIRMFVYYFSLKTSWKSYHRSVCFPWILNCLFHAFAISIKQYCNTNCLCTTEDDVLADYQFPLLFSRLNYALVLVLKVQVKLCTSVNFFSRIREREKLKWIKQWFDYFIGKKKQTKKQKNAHLVDILPTHKIFHKFSSGSRKTFPPLLPPTPVRQRMFTSTNQSVDSIWPTWFQLTARAFD